MLTFYINSRRQKFEAPTRLRTLEACEGEAARQFCPRR